MKCINVLLILLAVFFRRAFGEPFPEDFEDVTCRYLEALQSLQNDFGDPMPKFGDSQLNDYVRKAHAKLGIAEAQLRKTGNIIVAVDRVKQSMKFIEMILDRGKRLSRRDAERFGNTIGAIAGADAIYLIDDFITGLAGHVDSEFLFGVPAQKLELAQTAESEGNWRACVNYSLQAIRSIMQELDGKTIPVCNQQ